MAQITLDPPELRRIADSLEGAAADLGACGSRVPPLPAAGEGAAAACEAVAVLAQGHAALVEAASRLAAAVTNIAQDCEVLQEDQLQRIQGLAGLIDGALRDAASWIRKTPNVAGSGPLEPVDPARPFSPSGVVPL
jgi:hypothetical protein